MKRMMIIFLIATLLPFNFLMAAEKLTTKELAVSINLAGKQRMLTQKMTKEALLVKAGIDKKENLEKLKKSRALFDKTIKGLIHGDASLKLKPCVNKQVQKELHEVLKYWQKFDKEIAKVIDGSATKKTYENIQKQNLVLLEKMHKTVVDYVSQTKQSSSKRAQAINLAGKERMLTQRMAKDLLLISQKIAPKQNAKDLVRTSKEFETILHGLQKGDAKLGLEGTKLPAIKKQLKKADKLYKKIKPQFKKALRDPNVMKETISKLDELLAVMNKAVKKYEKSIQREKQAMQLSSLVNNFMQKKNKENHLINLAGKQRMLTQMMTKEALLVSLNIDPKKHRKLLEKSRKLYAKTLHAFAQGDASLDIAPVSNAEVIAYIKEVQKIWQPFSKSIEKIAKQTKGTKKALSYVVTNNEKLLQKSDRLVQLFKKNSEKKSFMEKARLNIVDIAGRQRMLTQKMTKEKLLILAKVAPKKNTKKLHESVTQFDTALKVLQNGNASLKIPKPSNQEVTAQLMKVSALWQKLQPFYLKEKLGKKDLEVIIKGNPVLLKEMNKAVHLSEVVADY